MYCRHYIRYIKECYKRTLYLAFYSTVFTVSEGKDWNHDVEESVEGMVMLLGEAPIVHCSLTT